MLVSIVICNYNYGRFLDCAIASAVNQRYPNTEVIVVDDGSTDESPAVIGRWDSKVAAIFQPNQGQLAAYNRGFVASRGDIVIFLDSDDSLDPDAVERVVQAFRDPAVVKVHYRLRLVDAAGRELGGSIPGRLSDGEVAELLRKGLLYHSSPGSGNAYRRSALARVMPLPVAADDPYAADFFTIHGLALLGPVRVASAAPLGCYRVHTDAAGRELFFGNSAAHLIAEKQASRYQRLRAWLLERLGPEYAIAPSYIDFSIQKSVFAERVLGSQGYLAGLNRGATYLRSTLLRSIWLRQAPRTERLGLTAWACAVLVLPRPVATPIARYVCNPASRGA